MIVIKLMGKVSAKRVENAGGDDIEIARVNIGTKEHNSGNQCSEMGD